MLKLSTTSSQPKENIEKRQTEQIQDPARSTNLSYFFSACIYHRRENNQRFLLVEYQL